MEGNEQADRAAKAAAENRQGILNPAFIAETSLSHLRRVTTERRTSATQAWIRERVGRRHRYRPPPGGKMRKELGGIRKELAGLYYQLLSGHAATANHLVRVGQSQSDQCWWCGSGEKQSQYPLFVKCRRWAPEIRRLWQRVEVDCGWLGPRAPTVRALFGNPDATPALLEFLDNTRVGRMPSQVELRGGGDRGEEDLEVVELEAPEVDVLTEESEEEGGPSPPL